MPDYDNGFNRPPTASGNEQPITRSVHQSRTLNYLSFASDWVMSKQIETMGMRRDFIVITRSTAGITEEWISPKPLIHRVGSGSKPFRLLGGQEVILSEDDVRVEGISKRYPLSTIWSYGTQYVMNPVLDPNSGLIDLDQSSVYELVFLDDSQPLFWTLNLRQIHDSRSNGIPLIP